MDNKYFQEKVTYLLPKVYQPKDFENKWYKYWEENNFFHAEVEGEKEAFSIVMPPPNITGKLHMGHAMDATLQDVLIRFKRMQGKNTLFLPGTDHAGIATQAKVEKELLNEGTSRKSLGREKFLERVFKWKEEYGTTITKQLRAMGVSSDWERERFTMDEGCSKAVREVFCTLYEEGLIYRGERITNWCPSCSTALSDIEVEHEDEKGFLYYIRYQIDGSDDFITISTTRPETMFGDTGIAVHPDDTRYQAFIGKFAILPIIGRKIPIFADSYVDASFGTGAVKVTPAHDPNDFLMGERHNLETIVIMEKDARMAKNTGKYSTMDRYTCRKVFIEDLQKIGAVVKIEEHEHAVGHCSRCHATVEPLISKQWFLKMQTLAKVALEAAEEKKITFIPERFEKIYINWLENIRDWCISRQLWWGHQIPAWYCKDCQEITVAREDIKECANCGSKNIYREQDVLDTWFSSALWPFATLGFPKKTKELNHFYPTSVLVTGYDILFFWVARMVMMGLHFTKDIPFRYVFLHGLVRDSEGRKMSKSLGNGIDPLEVIDKYGADTLRFMLVTGNTPGNDLRFYYERVEGMRNFANKLWNASRFVLMNLDDFDCDFVPEAKDYELADKWILSMYQKTVHGVTKNLEKFELGEAARQIYEFIWEKYCDWYIELSKKRLYEKDDLSKRKTAQYVLLYVLENTLKLLHPFMPFITEEIWHYLPRRERPLMLESWPKLEEKEIDYQTEEHMVKIIESIKAVRSMRLEAGVGLGVKSRAIFIIKDASLLKIVKENVSYLETLASINDIEFLNSHGQKVQNALSSVVTGVEIYLPLKGLIDIDKEKKRIQKEIINIEQELQRAKIKLANQNFTLKAPQQVVEKERVKLQNYEKKKLSLRQRLDYLSSI